MKFLLDTNAVIAVLKGDIRFGEKLRSHKPVDFGLSVVVLHELYYGAYRSARRNENVARIEQLRFDVIELSHEDARIAGALRAELAAAGTPIGPYDVLIAAQALNRRFTVVTHNSGEFSRVPDLQIEDWEA